MNEMFNKNICYIKINKILEHLWNEKCLGRVTEINYANPTAFQLAPNQTIPDLFEHTSYIIFTYSRYTP